MPETIEQFAWLRINDHEMRVFFLSHNGRMRSARIIHGPEQYEIIGFTGCVFYSREQVEIALHEKYVKIREAEQA